jgi:hypothetical protein
MSLISQWRPNTRIHTRETERDTTGRAPLQALRRILRLSGHRPRFHGFWNLGSMFGCSGFVYRTDIVFSERTPGDNESNRRGRQNWEPKLTGDHETNHWREAAPVARLTLIGGHFSRRLEALYRFGRAKGISIKVIGLGARSQNSGARSRADGVSACGPWWGEAPELP